MVRFEGNNGHDADVTRCLIMPKADDAANRAAAGQTLLVLEDREFEDRDALVAQEPAQAIKIEIDDRGREQSEKL